MQDTIVEDKMTGNLLQQHIATEKDVQSQERDLNTSKMLINIEVGAQTLLLTSTISFSVQDVHINE